MYYTNVTPYPMQSNYFNTNDQLLQMPGTMVQSKRSNADWIYVNGVQGARAQIVQPGCEAWMMDNNESLIYYKAVDLMGQPTFKSYRMLDVTPQGATYAPKMPQMDLSTFVTKEDVAEVSAFFTTRFATLHLKCVVKRAVFEKKLT